MLIQISGFLVKKKTPDYFDKHVCKNMLQLRNGKFKTYVTLTKHS